MPEWGTQTQYMQRWRIGRATLHRLMVSRRLPVKQVDGRRLVDLAVAPLLLRQHGEAKQKVSIRLSASAECKALEGAEEAGLPLAVYLRQILEGVLYEKGKA